MINNGYKDIKFIYDRIKVIKDVSIGYNAMAGEFTLTIHCYHTYFGNKETTFGFKDWESGNEYFVLIKGLIK